MVLTKEIPLPPVCRREVLRYAGCRRETEGLSALLQSCLREAEPVLAGRVCWRELSVSVEGEVCRLGNVCIESRNLAENMAGCSRAVVFAATVGAPLDRLIARSGVVSPARAVMLQALGAERVEALCDAFCRQLQQDTGMGQHPRFSPGYGDLPLEAQKIVFSLLEPMRHIGLSLTDSLLMSPTKSVTAFVGLTETPTQKHPDKCALCDKKDCAFRGVI